MTVSVTEWLTGLILVRQWLEARNIISCPDGSSGLGKTVLVLTFYANAICLVQKTVIHPLPPWIMWLTLCWNRESNKLNCRLLICLPLILHDIRPQDHHLNMLYIHQKSFNVILMFLSLPSIMPVIQGEPMKNAFIGVQRKQFIAVCTLLSICDNRNKIFIIRFKNHHNTLYFPWN